MNQANERRSSEPRHIASRDIRQRGRRSRAIGDIANVAAVRCHPTEREGSLWFLSHGALRAKSTMCKSTNGPMLPVIHRKHLPFMGLIASDKKTTSRRGKGGLFHGVKGAPMPPTAVRSRRDPQPSVFAFVCGCAGSVSLSLPFVCQPQRRGRGFRGWF